MLRALAGLRRYQDAERAPLPPPAPAIAEAVGATLRDYGGGGGNDPAVLFVPSLINPPRILDLAPGRSLLRWLAGRGHRVLLLDWGWPDEKRQTLTVAGHVEEIVLPLLRAAGPPPVLVGYCLGGTMAMAAAALAPTRGLVTLAAPWRFAGFPPCARAGLAELWLRSKHAAERLGLLPMEALQAAFWSLDPARTVAKFEAFADLEGAEADAFVALEDWANDGPPIGVAAAAELFEQLFGEDLTGAGRWRVGGQRIDPGELAIPFLNLVSASDRIVPAESAAPAGERRVIDRGHVGMVVGSRAREALWEPLDAWLSRSAANC